VIKIIAGNLEEILLKSNSLIPPITSLIKFLQVTKMTENHLKVSRSMNSN
jgi:hypothetical protein